MWALWTKGKSGADQQNLTFFWTWSTKFDIFLHLIDKICNFSEANRQNPRFVVADRQNSWFFCASLTKFAIFPHLISKIRYFSSIDNICDPRVIDKLRNIFMSDQWNSQFSGARSIKLKIFLCPINKILDFSAPINKILNS